MNDMNHPQPMNAWITQSMDGPPRSHVTLGTIGTLISLSLVSCRDPGILRRVNQEPNESKEAREKKQHRKTWMWNDQAHTWKPTMASYDNDVNAVVRGFDHVCPFTGTAIGANNLRSFHAFTLSINILIYYTIGVRATKMHAP
mmetsp:Transcript_34791/g.92866  ORF Transcript_34791/g.92866 Transcript_34791/m.92866 type:complete len:143 (+) Transcript_34791:82-510(+)